MPTHQERYHGKFNSLNGENYTFKIFDKNYAGTSIPVETGAGGVKIDYDTSGQEKFSPIIASKCSMSFIIERNPFGLHFENFINLMRTTYEEGDVTVIIMTPYARLDPLWSGNVTMDLSAKEDVAYPYEVELTATDGLGLLKNYDMVKTQGSNPYEAGDTYLGADYQNFIYWIKEILAFCNTPDNDSTDGQVNSYTFSTSVNWWYENHPVATSSISPLYYTKAQMLGAYELKEDGTYKVPNVYKVLEAICRMWGMRVVFWKNRFYFVQIDLLNNNDSGTYAAPDNIDSQIWNNVGVFSSGNSYIGDVMKVLYTQDIKYNHAGFTGGLQKLAGSKWDFYPKLKQVSVDFANINNNSYLQYFPLAPSQPADYTDGEDTITTSPLGILTDADTFSGFNIKIDLEFNNTGFGTDYQYNFSVRARPNGDTDWDNGYYLEVQSGATPTWESYPLEAVGGAAAVWYDRFIAAGSLATFGQYLQQYDIYPNVGVINLPSGMSQHTIFNQQVVSDSAFSGDWEFELFTLGATDQGIASAIGFIPYGGHHVAYDNGNYLLHGMGTDVTYSDVLDANNNPTSQFNPILNNVIGGNNVNTTVYTATTDTQHQEVKDIWWGDTLTYGEPASLRYDNGSGGSGYTDPTGKWRNGVSGLFNRSLAELLAESRLYNQQKCDYKWSLGTAVSATNKFLNDGSGVIVPTFINPVGRIYEDRERIYYYMLRGSFDLYSDTWDAEWVELSFDNTISTTTTTTGTGGSDRDNNIADMRLSGSTETPLFNRWLSVGELNARVTNGSTVTSLTIREMNPIIYEEEGETTLYQYEQNTLIKSGDVFNVVNTGNGQRQQFTASADVDNTDTTISVISVDMEKPLEVGSKIMVNIRDTYQQVNHKTRGTVAGFTIDSDGIAKGGVEITGWLDSDTMSGAAGTNVPTSKSVKAYVDISITQEFLMATCTGTVLTSGTNGEANAVTIPFDTEGIQSTGEDIFISTEEGEDNNIKTSTIGVYQFNWNVASDTSGTNNRINCGVKLQEGTYVEEAWSYADLDPSHCYIYNRANGSVARLGSTSGSLLVNCNSAKIYRLVFWKDSASSATTKGITEIDGTQLTVRKIT